MILLEWNIEPECSSTYIRLCERCCDEDEQRVPNYVSDGLRKNLSVKI